MTGTALEKSVGMPWCMGCCCVNPLAAGQIVRYQNQIKGFDVSGDFLIPLMLISMAYGCCGLPCLCLGPYIIGKTVKMKTISDAYESRSAYLA